MFALVQYPFGRTLSKAWAMSRKSAGQYFFPLKACFAAKTIRWTCSDVPCFSRRPVRFSGIVMRIVRNRNNRIFDPSRFSSTFTRIERRFIERIFSWICDSYCNRQFPHGREVVNMRLRGEDPNWVLDSMGREFFDQFAWNMTVATCLFRIKFPDDKKNIYNPKAKAF